MINTDRVIGGIADHPARVAVDGIAAPGKATLAGELTAAVHSRDRRRMDLRFSSVGTMTAPPLRVLLRSLPSLAGPLPTFDPDTAPADPDTLFAAWLTAAIDAAVPEPHAMTLSTTDSAGRPSARILILKNLSDGVWHFATSATSRKGTELATTPWAALTFYWPALGRQIRVRGPVVTACAEHSAQDFLDRSPAARATALLGNQSQPLSTAHELAGALKIATEKITNDPTLVAPDWTLYGVHATEAEFWQAHPHRHHTRLHYTRTNTTWTRHLLWP